MVALGNRLLKSFGVDRKAKGRCLKVLQRAGLVTVLNRPGCNPMVTLLDTPEEVKQEDKGNLVTAQAMSVPRPVIHTQLTDAAQKQGSEEAR